jgi:hypothetical protein
MAREIMRLLYLTVLSVVSLITRQDLHFKVFVIQLCVHSKNDT